MPADIQEPGSGRGSCGQNTYADDIAPEGGLTGAEVRQRLVVRVGGVHVRVAGLDLVDQHPAVGVPPEDIWVVACDVGFDLNLDAPRRRRKEKAEIGDGSGGNPEAVSPVLDEVSAQQPVGLCDRFSPPDVRHAVSRRAGEQGGDGAVGENAHE